MVDRSSQSSESRDRVLNAAYGLFVQRGYTAVSMQQIAEEAGITKATLYHHFVDKQDLYIATIRLAIANNKKALTQQLDGLHDLRTTVRALIAFAFDSRHNDLHRLASDFKQHIDATTQNELWSQLRPPWHLIHDAVQRAIEHEHVVETDAMFISRYIYGATMGVVHQHRFEPKEAPVDDDLLDRITDSMVYGLIRNQAAAVASE